MRFIPKPSKPVYKLPRSLQKSVPISEVHMRGILQHGEVYSVTVEADDINYTSSADDDQKSILESIKKMYKSLDIDSVLQVTMINQRKDEKNIIDSLCVEMEGDELDVFRKEQNAINISRAAHSRNGFMTRRFFTLSSARKAYDVQPYFNRVVGEFINGLKSIGCDGQRMSTAARLQLFHSIYRGTSASENFNLDIALEKRRGHDIKDFIAPLKMRFHEDYFIMGDKYCRALVLQDYPKSLYDNIITGLMQFPAEMIVSFHLIQKSREESTKLIDDKMIKLRSDIGKASKRALNEKNILHQMSYKHEHQDRELKQAAELVKVYDERLALGQMTLVHMADSLEKLDMDTMEIKSRALGRSCRFETLTVQQEQGLNTALPFGMWQTEAWRTFMTESAAVLMPYDTQEVDEPGGVTYAINEISRNLIRANRRLNLQNGNGVFLGVPGSGKSFLLKDELFKIFFMTDEDIFIVDPEGEYTKIVEKLGGTVIRLQTGSENHINAMEVSPFMQERDKPIETKTNHIMTLFDIGLRSAACGDGELSLIDRCVRELLLAHQAGEMEEPPTLVDVYNMLKGMEDEPKAKPLALAMERYVTGSLDLFAQQTNVDMQNRVICFDIRDLGEQLKGMGMYVVLDAIFNRVAYNQSINKGTRVYIDEIWTLLKYPEIAKELDGWWKRFRKYGGIMTGVTQNTSPMLENPTTAAMLANSEFVMMLNQASSDKQKLVELFNLSETQVAQLTNAQAGHGLMRCGKALVAFDATVDKNTELYRILDTRLKKEEVNYEPAQADPNEGFNS